MFKFVSVVIKGHAIKVVYINKYKNYDICCYRIRLTLDIIYFSCFNVLAFG